MAQVYLNTRWNQISHYDIPSSSCDIKKCEFGNPEFTWQNFQQKFTSYDKNNVFFAPDLKVVPVETDGTIHGENKTKLNIFYLDFHERTID